MTMSHSFNDPEYSKEWCCYLFGSKPGSSWSYVYRPTIDNIPSPLQRWCMRVFLGCTWVRTKPTIKQALKNTLQVYEGVHIMGDSRTIIIDPAEREWEYTGEGVKVYKGTNTLYEEKVS